MSLTRRSFMARLGAALGAVLVPWRAAEAEPWREEILTLEAVEPSPLAEASERSFADEMAADAARSLRDDLDAYMLRAEEAYQAAKAERKTLDELIHGIDPEDTPFMTKQEMEDAGVGTVDFYSSDFGTMAVIPGKTEQQMDAMLYEAWFKETS